MTAASIPLPVGGRSPHASRRPVVLVLVVVAVLLGGACGSNNEGSGSDRSGAHSAEVAIKDDFFAPEQIRVTAGDEVRWTWEGDHPHNVRGDDFESNIKNEGTYSHTFEQAGTFDYICTVHPSMTASVVVAAS